MDLAFGFVLGFLALPLWWMLLLTGIFIVDVVLCENDEFAWGTAFTVISAGLLCLGADVNPFTWLWGNLADVARFLLIYFLIGGLWSIMKWYLHLLKVRDKARADFDRFKAARTRPEDAHLKRPSDSYARENKGRIMGWVAHWPFSIVGSVLGDFLTRIVKSIYNVLSDLYDRMANHVFKDFDSER